MGRIKISIICPVYNVEKYLPRCIDSILAQSFQDFELLLVDDGSLDNSGKICDVYANDDGRIRVFHKKNGGVSSARNFGLKHACGEWISFVDTDDWVDSDFLEPVSRIPVTVELVHQGLKKEYPDNIVKIVRPSHQGVFETKELFSTKMWSSFCWSYFFKKDIIDKHKLVFNERLKFSEDRLFIFQYASLTSKMEFLDTAPYHYLINPTSACRSERDPKTFYNDLIVIRSFIDSWQQYNKDNNDSIIRFVLKMSIDGMKSDLSPYYSSINKKELVAELKRCREFVRSFYGNQYDDIFTPFIRYPKMTLIDTRIRPKIYSAICKLLR